MDRPSPKIHASENPVGLIQKGQNNENWIILEKNKIKKWYELGKYKQYFTYNTGAIPYRIIINDKHVYVFMHDKDLYSDIYSMLVLNIKYDNVFLGNDKTKYLSYRGKYDGTPILIETDNKYILVGNRIYSLPIKEQVLQYYIISKDDTQIPMILTQNYVYCVKSFQYYNRVNNSDPYYVFYDYNANGDKSIPVHNMKPKILNKNLTYNTI